MNHNNRDPGQAVEPGQRIAWAEQALAAKCFHWLCKNGHSEQEASDLLQEALISLLQTLTNHPHYEVTQALLFTVVKGRRSKYLARVKNRLDENPHERISIDDTDYDQLETADTAGKPLDHSIQEEFVAVVAEHVRPALPDQHWRILCLHFADLNQTQIAKQLKISVGSVNGKLRDGLKTARTILEKLGYGFDDFAPE